MIARGLAKSKLQTLDQKLIFTEFEMCPNSVGICQEFKRILLVQKAIINDLQSSVFAGESLIKLVKSISKLITF